MKTFWYVMSTVAAFGTMAPIAAAQQPPDYYVGAGVRTGLRDETAFVLDSKAKVADLGDFTLSVRPAVLFGSDVELRLPVTVDFGFDQGFYPYAGVGVAYNESGSAAVDPMISGGVDWSITQNLVLDLNLNMLFQSGGTDTEFAATLNYAF
jgi:hypothetical protein